MADRAAAVAAMRTDLSPMPDMYALIRYATLAANSHNTQPWLFRIADKKTEVLPDFSRRTPAVDPDDHHLFASLGCAAENLSIAANARGIGGRLRFEPAGDGSIIYDVGARAEPEEALYRAIPRRQSTRAEYDGTQVGADDLQALRRAASIPGVTLVLISGRAQIDRLRDLVVAGNETQMADQAFMSELKTWLRFSPRRAVSTGDGLFGACSGSPALPEWLGPLALDLFFTAESESKKYTRQIASSAGIAVFLADKADPEHWVLAGRACQRFALQATALGLKHAFLNQPVEVPELRPELAALAGLPGRRPDIVMRFGRSSEMPYSARRSVESVVVT
ncbi:Acg family FMN-binding oxidoreductase [Aquibium carbonis]|nr:nitroreductase family protein [Aquibium carbonis]